MSHDPFDIDALYTRLLSLHPNPKTSEVESIRQILISLEQSAQSQPNHAQLAAAKEKLGATKKQVQTALAEAHEIMLVLQTLGQKEL